MIKKLRENRNAVVEKYRFGYLGDVYSNMAHQIYVKGEFGEVHAKKLKEFYRKIK